jgi:hypothetical protein
MDRLIMISLLDGHSIHQDKIKEGFNDYFPYDRKKCS